MVAKRIPQAVVCLIKSKELIADQYLHRTRTETVSQFKGNFCLIFG